MDLWSLLKALERSWWVITGMAVLSGAGAWLFLPAAPYEATVEASVIVPGDLERPGRAERPELMVLDDLLPLVESPAFAALVHRSLESPMNEEVPAGAVQAMLTGSRYSRILSVTVSGSSAERVQAISAAVTRAIPEAVTTYLVAPGEAKPAIRIIDPGITAERQTFRRWLMIGVIELFVLFAMISVVWFREAFRISRAREGDPHSAADEGTMRKNSLK